MFSFTKEAEKAISLFLEKLDRKIDEFGFEMSDERRKDFLLAVYHSLRLSSIRHAKNKGRNVVEEKDAKASFRFLSLKMLIRHGLQNPKNFKHIEKLRMKHFQMIKERMDSITGAQILDAGCGYGRQLMGVLHLVRDVNKTIQEFARILKPNGLLFVTLAFAGNKLIGNMAYLIWKVILQIGRLYYIDDFEKFLNQKGFTKIFVDKAFSMPLKLGNVYFCTGFLNEA